MNGEETFLTGSILLVVIACSAFISLLLFLLYLRCIVRNGIIKRNRELASAWTMTEVCTLQHLRFDLRDGDIDSETESIVLIMPRQDTPSYIFDDTEHSKFFKLPSDIRKNSYYRFGSVDGLIINDAKKRHQPSWGSQPEPNLFFGCRNNINTNNEQISDKASVQTSDNSLFNKENENSNFDYVGSSFTSSDAYSFLDIHDDFQTSGAFNNREVLI